MIWAWFWAVLFLAAAVALVLVGRWCWREMGELGAEGDHAAPVKRPRVTEATVPVVTAAGSPPWAEPAFLSAPPDLVPGAGLRTPCPVTTATCQGDDKAPKVDSPAPEAPAAAGSNLPEPPPPAEPPAITAYASALEAAERERQEAEAAALAEALAWQEELRAEAEATSPWVEREPFDRWLDDEYAGRVA